MNDIKDIEQMLESINKFKLPEINFQDDSGNTQLMWATTAGHKVIVQWLLDKGADINLRNNYGYTTLMLAEMMEQMEIVELLKTVKNKEKDYE